MVSSRRQLLEMSGMFVAGIATGAIGEGISGMHAFRQSSVVAEPPPKELPPISRCAPLVYPDREWWGTELNNFLDALPNDGLASMKNSLWPNDGDSAALTTHSHDVHEILVQLNWISSSIFTYAFKDEWSIHYHAIVTWAGRMARHSWWRG